MIVNCDVKCASDHRYSVENIYIELIKTLDWISYVVPKGVLSHLEYDKLILLCRIRGVGVGVHYQIRNIEDQE